MTKVEYNQIVTVEDLESFRIRIINELKCLLLDIKDSAKEFYSPKEFSYATGIKYSTVVNYCKVGKLKARQDSPKCSWQIFSSEIERYKYEATKNIC